jgi:hypothetical protein
MTLGQTDRFRDRKTNRRREPNPLTRSYDSRGPDIRIRGTALHVAERYLQLARDAHTASNPVAAENYLQHAEHYFRLVAAPQAEQLEGQTSDGRATEHSAPEDLDIATISMACPIASPLRSSKRGKPSATKPMVLPRLLRNRTRNDRAGLGAKSRRLSTVVRPPASISARSFSQDARATSVCSAGQRICMISRERLALSIGSASPASIERAALVRGDAPGLAKPYAHYTVHSYRLCKERACSWLAGGGPFVSVSHSEKLMGNLAAPEPFGALIIRVHKPRPSHMEPSWHCDDAATPIS